MERQAKDGTIFEQVGQDQWKPITRTAKDGTVFKKVGNDQWSPLETESEEPDGPLSAFVAKAANSALLGYAPEIYAGGKQIYEDIKSVLPGGSPADKTVYDREIEKYRSNDASLEENNPVSSFAGSLVGYAAPGSAIAKGIRSARGAVGLAPQAASLLGKSSILGTEGALMGAVEKPSTNQDIVNIPERLNNALVGGAFSAAMPIGIEGIKQGFKAIPTLAKKTTAILGGVSEENISAFLKDPDRYMNAKPRDEVLATITGLVDDINTKVDDGKLSVKDAKEGLRWAGQQIKETASENHAIARDQLRQAEQRLRDKFVDSVNDLKAKPAPTQLQGQIDDTLRGMKEENIKASGESFDILQGEIGARQKALGDSGKVNIKSLSDDAENKSIRLVKEPAKESIEALEKTVIDEFEPPKTTINVRGVYSSLKAKAKELSSRNSADAKAAVKDLIKYMDDIKAKTADPDGNPTWWLDAAEAKRIIQDLDSDVKSWDSSKIAGQFDDKYNQTMKQVRYKLDDKLKKEFPEYRKKMSEISERSKLLGEASKRFGKPELAFSRLSNIASDKAKFDRELLSKLGKYTGQDLDTPIADFVKTQKMIKDPKKLESLKRSLPEFDQLTDAQKLEKMALLDKSPKSFRSKLSKSPSFKELKMAQKDFDAALVDKDKIKGWTKSTVDGKLNAVMRGKTYVRSQLETLGKMSNQDLVKMVDDLKVSEAFEKEFRIGSRNVNLFTALGMGFIGGGPIGLIVGAATGAMVDRYGPALTKKALIAVSKVQGAPSVQKLSKLGLPKSIAQELTDSFYASLIGSAIQENKKQTVIKNKGETKWAQDGMRNIEIFAQQKENLDILSQIQKLDQTDPEVKKLLIEASDFKPGSIGFQKVIDKLSQLKKKGE